MRKVLIIAIGLMSVCVSLETATAAKFERWWPPGFVTTWAPPQLRAIMKSTATGNNRIGQSTSVLTTMKKE